LIHKSLRADTKQQLAVDATGVFTVVQAQQAKACGGAADRSGERD
jgi:hypothetical protein